MSEKKVIKPAYEWVEKLQLLRPTDTTDELFISGSEWKPGPEDIIVATYPKCGTTWTQSILWMITHDLQPCPDPNFLIFDRFIEFKGSAAMEKFTEQPRVTKTHFPRRCAPWNPDTKYIVVVRNPFDCVTSYYHHTKSFVEYAFQDGEFDVFFDLFMKGEVDWGCYFEHLVSWYKVKDEPNVMFVLFEDMKSNLEAVLRRMGKFLGGEYEKMLQDQENIDKIMDGVKLDKLGNAKKVIGLEGKFFRKGVIGDWKKHLTPEMIESLKAKIKEYDDKYDIWKIWSDYEDSLPKLS